MMPPLRLAIWGDIWKHTVEKSQTNATNVTMPLLKRSIWGDIWKCTVQKSRRNATNVTLHQLTQAISGHIWKHTVEKSQPNEPCVTMPLLRQRHMKNHRKVKQLMWLCFFSSRPFIIIHLISHRRELNEKLLFITILKCLMDSCNE